MSLIFLPGKIPRSSTSTAMANTLNDGSAVPTFRDEKRRLCRRFFAMRALQIKAIEEGLLN
jgi:hypothetical protein